MCLKLHAAGNRQAPAFHERQIGTSLQVVFSVAMGQATSTPHGYWCVGWSCPEQCRHEFRQRDWAVKNRAYSGRLMMAQSSAAHRETYSPQDGVNIGQKLGDLPQVEGYRSHNKAVETERPGENMEGHTFVDSVERLCIVSLTLTSLESVCIMSTCSFSFLLHYYTAETVNTTIIFTIELFSRVCISNKTLIQLILTNLTVLSYTLLAFSTVECCMHSVRQVL